MPAYKFFANFLPVPTVEITTIVVFIIKNKKSRFFSYLKDNFSILFNSFKKLIIKG